MPLTRIEDIESRLLDPYRNLRTSNLTRFSGRFIAESRPLVAKLLASDLQVESVLIDEAFLGEAQTWVPEGTNLLVVPTEMISELIGFHFHRGYLACGIRPTPGTFDEFLTASVWPTEPTLEHRWTGVLVVGVQDPENLGSIFRTCSALGIGDIFIGPNSVDPFARRVLRVSMGNAFKLRFHTVEDVVGSLQKLKRVGVESIAACLAEDSEELATFSRKGNALILLGNEAHGLPWEVQQASSRRLKIAMDLETDSLNVSVAAGIILHNLCRIC